MMKIETIEVNGKMYVINITFENRPDSRVSIGKNINIRIPTHLNREQKFRELIRMKKWAVKRLEEKPREEIVEKMYKDGDVITIGDENYKVCIDEKDEGVQSSSGKLLDNTFFIKLTPNISEERKRKHISTLMSRCLGAKKKKEIINKVHELNQKHFKKQINKIFLKNTSSRWGSCSSNENINLSTRLFFAPEDVIDYVIIHELAHLIEQNHSKDFWNLVERAMPDYKTKEKWLKDNGKSCVF